VFTSSSKLLQSSLNYCKAPSQDLSLLFCIEKYIFDQRATS